MPRYAVGIAALLLAACSGGQQPATSEEPTASTRADGDMATTLPSAPPDATPAEVVYVFDGDSLIIRVDGEEIETRLIGVNAPEGGECHGDTARENLERLLASGEVTVVADDEQTDQFDRALRYLYVDGLNVNQALLANGDAVALQTGHSAEDDFTRIADAAYSEGFGMWALDVCGPLPGGSLPAIVDYRYNPPGRDEDSMNDEWVAIANVGSMDLDLGGWILRDESTQNRFRFPDGFTLAPAAEVLVRSGCGADGPSDLYWCAGDPVWSNGGDTIILQTPDGTVAARDRFAGDF